MEPGASLPRNAVDIVERRGCVRHTGIDDIESTVGAALERVDRGREL